MPSMSIQAQLDGNMRFGKCIAQLDGLLRQNLFIGESVQ
jgi:hypothetical protein